MIFKPGQVLEVNEINIARNIMPTTAIQSNASLVNRSLKYYMSEEKICNGYDEWQADDDDQFVE